jgi:Ca2+-binding RTX toxin-like protein
VRSIVFRRVVVLLLVPMVAVALGQSPASAATITATRDAAVVAAAVADPLGSALTSQSLPVIAPAVVTECSNGEDDDFDGFIDFTPPPGETADPGCDSASDNQEEDDLLPECSNGFDDDGDGSVDFVPPAGETADPDCTSAADLDEGSEGFPVTSSDPVAVVTSALSGFPTSGGSFAILSSGSALIADDPNGSGGDGEDIGGGGGTHGPSFHDLVTLKLDLTVPAGVNCLSLDFRFLSEEFPEFVGSNVNDGFVAELDTSDFTADEENNNAVVAPHNFAFDEAGNVVSINTAGFAADAADGTTYDGATPKLRAITPITPGAHSVYLSVFDQGDGILDSAAFLDNLRLFTVPAGSCQAGATDDLTPPDTTITSGPSGTTSDTTPTFTFTSSEAGSTFECRVDGGAWVACTTPFTTAELSPGDHTFEVRATDGVGNVDPTPASRAFTVEVAPPPPPPPATPTCDGLKATMVGTPGDDVLTGTSGKDVIVGLGGNDEISGGGGNDVICGGDGDDKLVGAAGNDVVLGEAGKDKLIGGGGKDEMDGGAGNDRLLGNGGDDRLTGGSGDDRLTGAAGKDDLDGGAGDDRLVAGGGADTLEGGGGNDFLDGGPGRDKGDGGSGTNVVIRCEE